MDAPGGRDAGRRGDDRIDVRRRRGELAERPRDGDDDRQVHQIDRIGGVAQIGEHALARLDLHRPPEDRGRREAEKQQAAPAGGGGAAGLSDPG